MVKNFLMNLLLSFTWVALTGDLFFANFYLGFLLGFFILWLMNHDEGDKRYFNRVPKVIGFVFYFLWEMLKANLQVAYDVVTPNYFMKPGIVKYRMNVHTDVEINMLATMISLTPGTLVIDVSKDKRVIYIHVMYLRDRDRFIRQIENSLEKRLTDVLR